MRLAISAHARLRMRQRAISEADIEHALSNHHSAWETPRGGVQYIGPTPSGRELKVWLVPPGYARDVESVTVKSTAWRDEEDVQ